MGSLRDKTISGVFWSFGQQFGGKGIAILTTVILARLLTPRDFGLIAMLSVFISVSQGISEGGFNQALIQKKNADEEDYSSVFYINLVVSLFLYITLFFCAPLIADFYSQPELIPMTRVLSLVFVINSFSYVQKARLAKEMKFKTLMVIHLPSIIISAIVALTLAYTGFGVWSLVVQQLVQRTAYAVQIWIYAKWKPLWTFNKDKAKGLFSFGSRLMVANVFNKFYNNAYFLVIGKFFATDILGYYKASDSLTKAPTQTIANAIKAVTFPSFSSIQDDNERLKRGYKKAIQLVLFWVCPVMVLAAVMATPLFRLVLTEKWLPAVPYFRILCVIGIIIPLSDFNLDIITVKGRSDLFLKLNIVKKIILTIGIIATFPFGIWPLLIFQVCYKIFVYFFNGYFTGGYINYPVKEQLIDVIPIIGLSLGMGLLVFGLDLLIRDWTDLLRLVTGVLLSFSFYFTVAKYTHLSTFEETIKIVNERLKRIIKK